MTRTCNLTVMESGMRVSKGIANSLCAGHIVIVYFIICYVIDQRPSTGSSFRTRKAGEAARVDHWWQMPLKLHVPPVINMYRFTAFPVAKQ